MNDGRRPPRRPRQSDHYADSTAVVRRLPPACVLYERAAQLERLAVVYALDGHRRRLLFGIDLADRVEHWADLKAAA